MDIDYLILADAATAAGGKLYIHGAGWDGIFGLSFPLQHPGLAVALRLRVPWTDTNRSHVLEMDLMDADGASLLPAPLRAPVTAGRPPQLPVGEDQVIPMAVVISGPTFPRPGTYAVVARIDGLERSRSPFRVIPLVGAVVIQPPPAQT